MTASPSPYVERFTPNTTIYHPESIVVMGLARNISEGIVVFIYLFVSKQMLRTWIRCFSTGWTTALHLRGARCYHYYCRCHCLV